MTRIKMYRSLLFAGLVLLMAGCATHSQNAGMAINRLRSGDTASALQWSEKLKTSLFSKDLGYLESGRIKMLEGDFTGSRADFATAIDKVLETTENGPVIKVSSVGSTVAASTVADDTIRNYELSPYEIIQLLHYQTLNYLFCGDSDGASVEMRRTVFAQDAIAEKYSKEVADAQTQSDATKAKAMDAVNAKMATMGPALERTRSSHENGLAWYFCGLIFEKQGDTANATLCYRKAWELSPQNPDIVKDFIRLLQTQDRQAFLDLVLQNNMDVKSLTRGSTEIIVLVEDSMISQRHAEKIPLPIPDFRGAITLISIDFPFYSDSAYTPLPFTITDNGTELGVATPVVYLQSLAYRDLKEKMTGIVVRNVTRAVTKVAAQQVVNNQNDDMMKLGMMAFNAVSSLASTSDTRAWYSIPMATQLYRGSISAGTHTLECRSPVSGNTITIPVTVAEGETRLIWIADTGGITVAATASLSGKGLPPTYQQFNNPFNTNGVSGCTTAAVTPGVSQ
ncbi:MAG: hypothetical protein HOO88_04885 [Kiritimatiellaceae bacterium]|nr:hypothetical protein [Kiritimatiellaceae bacterium]